MQQPIEIHTVPEREDPIRLQEYGVGIFQNCPTKSALKKRLKKGLITVDEIVASTATYIRGGEVIRLFSDNRKRPIYPLNLKVLYEDDYLAVIHKPPGVVVSGNSFQTIANALEHNLEPNQLGDYTNPLPIHRLDFPTTGALLIGKTGACIRALYRMFETKEIHKVYLAITIGNMLKSGTIQSDVEEKMARTNYDVVTSVPSKRFKQLNLVQLTPETGRRHQLRKHLFRMGTPILGDKDYALEGLLLKGKGLYLHAYSLKFQHPISREPMRIVDTDIDRFKKIIPDISRFLADD